MKDKIAVNKNATGLCPILVFSSSEIGTVPNPPYQDPF